MISNVTQTHYRVALAINLIEAAECTDGGKILGATVVLLRIGNINLNCIV